MKKIFTTLAVAALAVPAMFAQDQLYVSFSSQSYTGFSTDDTSTVLSPVAGKEGVYEGTFVSDKSAGSATHYFKFFSLDDQNEATFYGMVSATGMQFKEGNNPVSYRSEADVKSPFFVYDYIPTTLTSAEIKATVDIINYTFTFEQLNVEVPAPNVIYIWGSTEGGVNTKVMGEMVPAATGSTIYTLTWDLPEANYNPDDAIGGTSTYGFSFYLSTSNESYGRKGTIYLAPKPADESSDVEANNVINVAAGETFKATLLPTTLDAANLLAPKPGNYTFTFDYETLEFTATLNAVDSSISLVFEGEKLPYNLNDAITVYNLSYMTEEDEDMEILYVNTNPLQVYFTEMAALIIEPKEGYLIEVTAPEVEGLAANLLESGKYQVVAMPEADGATVTVVITQDTENGVSSINGENGEQVIYNLQGVRVDANKVQKGIYIINGKKVIL